MKLMRITIVAIVFAVTPAWAHYSASGHVHVRDQRTDPASESIKYWSSEIRYSYILAEPEPGEPGCEGQFTTEWVAQPVQIYPPEYVAAITSDGTRYFVTPDVVSLGNTTLDPNWQPEGHSTTQTSKADFNQPIPGPCRVSGYFLGLFRPGVWQIAFTAPAYSGSCRIIIDNTTSKHLVNFRKFAEGCGEGFNVPLVTPTDRSRFESVTPPNMAVPKRPAGESIDLEPGKPKGKSQ